VVIVVCAFVIIFPVASYMVVRKHRNLKKQDRFYTIPGSMMVFFESFKQENWMQYHFVTIALARGLLHFIFIVTLVNNTMTQLALITVLNGLMILYLVIYRPFVFWNNNVKLIGIEILIFTVFIICIKFA